jgi:hypothetical protein
MKPNKKQIADVVDSFGALSFFPRPDDVAARKAVMRLIEGMVNDVAELNWLQAAMINRVGEWKGPADLRGVLCAYGVMNGKHGWQPADGIWATSNAPGYTQDDRNARWSEQEGAALTEGKDDALRLASGAEMKLLPLPPEEIVKNDALLRQVERTKPQRVPEPTVADREYSRKLLGGIPGLT